MKKFIRLLAVTALMLAATLTPALALDGVTPLLANGLTTTVKTVKSTEGVVAWLSCYNPNSAVAYVQFFDTAGAVTLGTTAPRLAVGLAPSATTTLPLARAVFLNGVKIAATTTATGSTAPTTAVVCNLGIR